MAAHGRTARRLAWTSDGQHVLVRNARMLVLFPLLTLAVVIAAAREHDVVGVPGVIGLVLLVGSTGITFGEAFRRCSPRAMVALPLLDIASLAAFHQMPGATAVGALIALPAMWLGGVAGRRGVLLVGVATLVLFAAPGVVADGTPVGGWPKVTVIALFGVGLAAALDLLASLWEQQLDRLESQGELLNAALVTVEEHRAHIDAIFQTVNVGLVELSADGSYGTMNPRHREFLDLGFPEGHEGRAGQLGDAYAADNVTLLSSDEMPSTRAANGETFSDYIIWIGTEPHARRAVSVSARPKLDEHGGFAGAVLAYHDITELMRALRVKDDFVASVSHELRTPLTSIIGYLDLAAERSEELPADVVHFLTVARRNSERLLILVADLLNAAQGDGEPVVLVRDATDVSALVQLAIDDARQRARAAHVALLSDIEPLELVMLDAGRVQQVVENLVSNALKYTSPGGTARVVLTREGSDIVLEVGDTGMGISAQDQPKVFTKFFRAANASSSPTPGVGLGLPITKAIVVAHGGAISLSSREGIGTTVRVVLPLVPATPVPVGV